VSATHTLGTIVLALGLLWFLYVLLVVVGLALALSFSYGLLCLISLGFYCPSVTPNWPHIFDSLVLPIAAILVGVVLRHTGSSGKGMK
jgi:hypothetical protein